MAMLTTAQIKQMEDGDYIVYKRQKIKRQKGVKPISIKITPAIRQLIGSLQAASPTVDDFLLPIVTRSGYTGERLSTCTFEPVTASTRNTCACSPRSSELIST